MFQPTKYLSSHVSFWKHFPADESFHYQTLEYILMYLIHAVVFIVGINGRGCRKPAYSLPLYLRLTVGLFSLGSFTQIIFYKSSIWTSINSRTCWHKPNQIWVTIMLVPRRTKLNYNGKQHKEVNWSHRWTPGLSIHQIESELFSVISQSVADWLIIHDVWRKRLLNNLPGVMNPEKFK